MLRNVFDAVTVKREELFIHNITISYCALVLMQRNGEVPDEVVRVSAVLRRGGVHGAEGGHGHDEHDVGGRGHGYWIGYPRVSALTVEAACAFIPKEYTHGTEMPKQRGRRGIESKDGIGEREMTVLQYEKDLTTR